MMDLKQFGTILLTLFTEAWATSGGIKEFLVDNGYRQVDIFYNSTKWQGFSLQHIFIARISMEDLGKGHKDSFGIFMFDSGKDDLVTYLKAIMLKQIKRSLLVISGPWDYMQVITIKRHLSDLQASALFYIAILNDNSTYITYYQMISLKSGSALSLLEFADNSSMMIEKYDMGGLKITSSSLTWSPYLTIDDCNEDGMDCAKNYGYLIDLMDKLAVKFNFTYVSHKNLNNSWFHIGPHGQYGGVWGDVISKQYDMSLSQWYWLSSRLDSSSFVPYTQGGHVLAFRPKMSIVDFGLVTRAFVWDTWVLVICISGSIFLAIFFAKIYGFSEVSNVTNVLTLTWWLFFTLLNAYYCGVLTMFLAAPSLVIFENMQDVVQAYPNWKLMFQHGELSWVHEMVESGIPEYTWLWSQYEENPTETIYYSIESGHQHVESGQNVILIDKNQLLGHIKLHPSKQKIDMITLRKNEIACILFYHNSPLLPMFNQGARYLRESGLERHLFYKWFGDLSEQNGPVLEGHVLTLGHMVTVFITIVVVFVFSLCVLCGELSFKRLRTRLSRNGQTRMR